MADEGQTQTVRGTYDRHGYHTREDGFADGDRVELDYESPYSGTVVSVAGTATDVSATAFTLKLDDGREWWVAETSIRTTHNSRRASGKVAGKNGRPVGYVETFTVCAPAEDRADDGAGDDETPRVMTDGGQTQTENAPDGPTATRYREKTTEYDPADDDLTAGTLLRADALEVRYQTHRGTLKTVRGTSPCEPGTMEDHDETLGVVFRESGEKWAYNPETRTLKSVNYGGEDRTLADGDHVLSVTTVDFPRRVPVQGAPQENVTATVWYRSDQSENLVRMNVEVDRFEGSGKDVRVSGEDPRRDRRVEFYTGFDRRVESRGRQTRRLGRVVRVEFPKGHRFTVDFENLPDDRAEKIRDQLERKAQSLANGHSRGTNVQVEVSVDHEGRYD
jgi:hypothetical protein